MTQVYQRNHPPAVFAFSAWAIGHLLRIGLILLGLCAFLLLAPGHSARAEPIAAATTDFISLMNWIAEQPTTETVASPRLALAPRDPTIEPNHTARVGRANLLNSAVSRALFRRLSKN